MLGCRLTNGAQLSSAQLNSICALMDIRPLPEAATASCLLPPYQPMTLASVPCLEDPHIDLGPCISITGHLGAKVRKLFDFLDYLSMQDDWLVWALVHSHVFANLVFFISP